MKLTTRTFFFPSFFFSFMNLECTLKTLRAKLPRLLGG